MGAGACSLPARNGRCRKISVSKSPTGSYSRLHSVLKSSSYDISQFSCSVMSDSLWPHGLQHPKLPYTSPTPGAYSNSCPSSWWCHPTISFSVIPFSSCLQSFPASGSFQMSQFFASGGQSIGVSASASVLPMNIQDWFRIACDIGSDNISGISWFWFDDLDGFEEDWSSICSVSLCLDILLMIISLGLCVLRWR